MNCKLYHHHREVELLQRIGPLRNTFLQALTPQYMAVGGTPVALVLANISKGIILIFLFKYVADRLR